MINSDSVCCRRESSHPTSHEPLPHGSSHICCARPSCRDAAARRTLSAMRPFEIGLRIIRFDLHSRANFQYPYTNTTTLSSPPQQCAPPTWIPRPSARLTTRPARNGWKQQKPKPSNNSSSSSKHHHNHPSHPHHHACAFVSHPQPASPSTLASGNYHPPLQTKSNPQHPASTPSAKSPPSPALSKPKAKPSTPPSAPLSLQTLSATPATTKLQETGSTLRKRCSSTP